jgi:hypothetical protein
MDDRLSDHFLLACVLLKQHGEQLQVGKNNGSRYSREAPVAGPMTALVL